MKNNIVVGLDIGTTKIAAIVAKKNDYGKVEILGIGTSPSAGVLRGSVMNIDKTVESIRAAIDEAQVRSGETIKEVYVGIAGQHIKSFQRSSKIDRLNNEDEITVDEVNDFIARMKKIQVDSGDVILHVIPQEYIVDDIHGIKDPVGMFGHRLAANFHIITGQDSAIRNIVRSVEKAGLVVKDLTLEPLASAAAVLDNNDLMAGVALVDIGGGTTDIAIYQDEKLRHTAVIALGGNIITEDIQGGCQILEPQAKKLKENFGSAIQSENKADAIVAIPGLRGREPREVSIKNLSGIIQARMVEIMEAALFEIAASGFEKKLIAGIVLTGGGALLKHVQQLTEFVSHMDTRIGYPNEHLSASESNQHIANPIYATGVGLVIMGLLKEEREMAEKEELITPPVEETPVEQELPATINEKPKKEPKTPKAPKVPKPARHSTSLKDRFNTIFEKTGSILENFLNDMDNDR
ncbi:MAG: cell division protein FtsA [Bacteroidales bacterium]|jgi:cell division protein FtsA|nr:cell division protein FtsA [Bacteroidales bacterium]